MKVPKEIQPHRSASDIQRWSEGLWNIESRGMFVFTLIPPPAHLSSALHSQSAHIKVETWLILGWEIYPRLDSPRCILFITVGCYYSPCLVPFINLFICRVQCIHTERVCTFKSLALPPDKRRWKSENGGRCFFRQMWRERFWVTGRHCCCCAQVLPKKRNQSPWVQMSGMSISPQSGYEVQWQMTWVQFKLWLKKQLGCKCRESEGCSVFVSPTRMQIHLIALSLKQMPSKVLFYYLSAGCENSNLAHFARHSPVTPCQF